MGWVTLAADGDDVVRSARAHDGTGGTNGTDVATIPCAASSTSPLASTAEDSHGSRHHAKRRTLRAGADPAGGTRAGAGLRKSRSAQRDPGPGAGAGRGRLAQCEPSATRSTPPRAARAQRDIIRLRSIRASPPRTIRPEVTSQNRLPGGRGARLLISLRLVDSVLDSPGGGARRERHAGSPDRTLGPRGEDSQANSSTDTTAGDRTRPSPNRPSSPVPLTPQARLPGGRQSRRPVVRSPGDLACWRGCGAARPVTMGSA